MKDWEQLGPEGLNRLAAVLEDARQRRPFSFDPGAYSVFTFCCQSKLPGPWPLDEPCFFCGRMVWRSERESRGHWERLGRNESEQLAELIVEIGRRPFTPLPGAYSVLAPCCQSMLPGPWPLDEPCFFCGRMVWRSERDD